MKQGYCVKKLPIGSISYDHDWRRSNRGTYKIKGGSFDDIPIKLNIRQRAVDFICPYINDTYVVLFSDEDEIKCLFAFCLIKTHGEVEISSICRCIGKNIVRDHWGIVRKYLNNCDVEKIQELDKGKELAFNF